MIRAFQEGRKGALHEAKNVGISFVGNKSAKETFSSFLFRALFHEVWSFWRAPAISQKKVQHPRGFYPERWFPVEWRARFRGCRFGDVDRTQTNLLFAFPHSSDKDSTFCLRKQIDVIVGFNGGHPQLVAHLASILSRRPIIVYVRVDHRAIRKIQL